MTETIPSDQAERIARLECRLRRTQAALVALMLIAAGAALSASGGQPEGGANADGGARAEPVDEIRARRIVVVDDAGVPRVVIGQDPADTQRRSRSAGVTIHDRHGHERGGMSTLDDGSVVLALDAPVGVGSPMRDRVGMVVWPDGSSYIMLLDNQTRAVAKLHSDGQGGGGVQVFQWDMDAKKIRTKTITYEGEQFVESDMGG